MLNVQINFLTKTEEILNNVVSTGDFDAGFNFINDMFEQGEVFSKSISVMLKGMEDAWGNFDHDGETFLQAAVRRTPLSAETVRRHTKIQRLLESDVIPSEFRDRVEEMDAKSLRDIANTIERGFELSSNDWQHVTDAGGDRGVRRELQKIKGEAPRSNFLAITIDERGVLVAHTANEHLEFGRLDVSSDEPSIQKAILRMTSCAGVLQKDEY